MIYDSQRINVLFNESTKTYTVTNKTVSELDIFLHDCNHVDGGCLADFCLFDKFKLPAGESKELTNLGFRLQPSYYLRVNEADDLIALISPDMLSSLLESVLYDLACDCKDNDKTDYVLGDSGSNCFNCDEEYIDASKSLMYAFGVYRFLMTLVRFDTRYANYDSELHECLSNLRNSYFLKIQKCNWSKDIKGTYFLNQELLKVELFFFYQFSFNLYKDITNYNIRQFEMCVLDKGYCITIKNCES